MDWSAKIADTMLAGIPAYSLALLPPHLKKQIVARVKDFNPFSQGRLSTNHDLLRATRLAWVEAAQLVVQIVKDRPDHAGQSQERSFASVLESKLVAIRHDALHRDIQITESPIDAHVVEIINGVPELTLPSKDEHELGGGVTKGFVYALSVLTGWPLEEVPPIFEQVAKAGLTTPGSHTARTFGELVFAAFAEIIKDPDRYPQAREAFHIAMEKAGRDLGEATFSAVRGLDEYLDRLTKSLDPLLTLKVGLQEQLAALPLILSTVQHVDGRLARLEERVRKTHALLTGLHEAAETARNVEPGGEQDLGEVATRLFEATTPLIDDYFQMMRQGSFAMRWNGTPEELKAAVAELVAARGRLLVTRIRVRREAAVLEKSTKDKEFRRFFHSLARLFDGPFEYIPKDRVYGSGMSELVSLASELVDNKNGARALSDTMDHALRHTETKYSELATSYHRLQKRQRPGA